jgi:hypothetical protein
MITADAHDDVLGEGSLAVLETALQMMKREIKWTWPPKHPAAVAANKREPAGSFTKGLLARSGLR